MKSVKLKDNTAILLSKAKAKYILLNPIMKAFDDDVINAALGVYIKHDFGNRQPTKRGKKTVKRI